jgi:hypothetical protein
VASETQTRSNDIDIFSAPNGSLTSWSVSRASGGIISIVTAVAKTRAAFYPAL